MPVSQNVLHRFGRYFAIVLLLTLTQCPHFAEAEEDFQRTVQSDVARLSDALFQKDYDFLLAKTHPNVLSLAGGKEGLLKTLKQAVASFDALEMKVDKLSFPEPPQLIRGKERDYALVPTFTILSSTQGAVHSHNFQFGVREHGQKDWVYIEGSRVNQTMLEKWFPDFPQNVARPRVSREKAPLNASPEQDVFTAYVGTIVPLIKSKWHPEEGATATAVVALSINADGSITNIKLDRSSNNKDFDEKVLAAVTAANPLPKPDARILQRLEQLRITFDPRQD